MAFRTDSLSFDPADFDAAYRPSVHVARIAGGDEWDAVEELASQFAGLDLGDDDAREIAFSDMVTPVAKPVAPVKASRKGIGGRPAGSKDSYKRTRMAAGMTAQFGR
jgi:hypothetical protein